jgi:glucose-6-phosphate-specific signal transduction histidine kinase
LGGNSQIFGILLPRLDTTLPRVILFAHKLTPTGVAILGHFFIPPFWAEIAKFLAFCCRDWTPLRLGQFSSPINLPAQVLQFWVTFLFST